MPESLNVLLLYKDLDSTTAASGLIYMHRERFNLSKAVYSKLKLDRGPRILAQYGHLVT